jgi:hypothetical protein
MEPKQHGSFLEPHGTTKTVAHGPHTQPSGGVWVIRLLHQFRLINFIKEAYFFHF